MFESRKQCFSSDTWRNGAREYPSPGATASTAAPMLSGTLRGSRGHYQAKKTGHLHERPTGADAVQRIPRRLPALHTASNQQSPAALWWRNGTSDATQPPPTGAAAWWRTKTDSAYTARALLACVSSVGMTGHDERADELQVYMPPLQLFERIGYLRGQRRLLMARTFRLAARRALLSMTKFPLPREAFPPATLSVDEQEALETLAEQQLRLAEHQLELHEQRDASVVDKRRWKPLKTRERITVYRERSSAAFHRQCHSHSQVAASSQVLGPQRDDDWPLPELLGVGSLEGSLEDVMYGIHTPTAAHMMAKAVVSDDEVVDAQVLQEIKGPTIAHPFRFLGVKWLVKAHPAAMGAVVLPRDVVYVEHAGIKVRADGSNLGHFLIHSVSLPQYPELRRELGLVRARVSSCVLLRQHENNPNQVDVFMTGRVAAQGRVLDSLALLSTANGLTYFWKAGVCAQRRKLAWRLQHKRKLPPAGASVPPAQCPLCLKGLDRAFCSSTHCEMCGGRMCTRCRVIQKLLFPGVYGSKETHLVSVELCTPCITRTTEEDAMAIARQEIRAGQYGVLTSPRGVKQRNRAFNVVKPRQKPHFSASAGPPVTKNPLPSQPRVDFAASARVRDKEEEGTVTRGSLQALDTLLKDSAGPKEEDYWEELTGSEDEPSLRLTPKHAPLTLEDLEGSGSDDSVDGATQLWQRMSALQVMAESTYRYTKTTTDETLRRSHNDSSTTLSTSSGLPRGN